MQSLAICLHMQAEKCLSRITADGCSACTMETLHMWCDKIINGRSNQGSRWNRCSKSSQISAFPSMTFELGDDVITVSGSPDQTDQCVSSNVCILIFSAT